MELGLQWRPSMESLSTRNKGAGRVFFVRANGDNENDGITPGTPFQTITYALTQCVTGRNDYIILMNNTSAVEPAFPIQIAINMVHILGMWGAPYPNPTLTAVGFGNQPTIQIMDGVTWVEIAGIDFGGGAANGCIQIGSGAGNTSYIWIHHCTFGYDAGVGAQDGIRWLVTHANAETYVEDCIFGALLTRDGCRLDGNNTRGVYRRNLFRLVPVIGINVNVAGADVAEISRNDFLCTGAGPIGSAITFVFGAGNAMVVDNRAGFAAAAMGAIPYRDLSTGLAATSLNAWVNNVDGILALIPSVV